MAIIFVLEKYRSGFTKGFISMALIFACHMLEVCATFRNTYSVDSVNQSVGILKLRTLSYDKLA